MGALQGYLDPKALPNSLALIPPPPAPGSAAFALDVEVAKNTFALRDTPRFALAASDFELNVPHFVQVFSCALNAQITKENAPYLYNLLSRSFTDVGLLNLRREELLQTHAAFSAEWRTPRRAGTASLPGKGPVVSFRAHRPRVGICPHPERDCAGSGRPDSSPAAGRLARAASSATIIGISDVVWGRFMGAATVARLHADPTFLADLEAAKAEFAALRAKGVPPTGDCQAEAAALDLGFQARSVTAIDILLEPDATMLGHSADNNARLLKVFPKGFPLDATHTPHITLIQRFVRTADLDKVYAAAAQVLARANVTALKLEAFKYYYIPTGDNGLAGICAKPTPELLKLQRDIIAAVAPFTVETGDSSAFVTTPDDPIIDPALIGYVSAFVPKATGDHFNPHVTTGVAPKTYLDPMLAAPFEPFTFSPAGAAVYQLGQFGTAAKKLKQLDTTR